MDKRANPLFTTQKNKLANPLFAVTTNAEVSDSELELSNMKVPPWKVLIIDDEPEVHSVTTLVLRDFEFNDRPISLFDAYSSAEAKDILTQESDIALCLIDVVMETDEAGLDLVKYIRNDLKNSQIRLVLRTGQPGYAPERDVIRDYDINDYKAKTELTDTKLHTLMCSAFRAYDDIMCLEQNRIGLEMVIDASANIFEAASLSTFASAVLMQLMALLNLSKHAVMVAASGFSATNNANELKIMAGVGEFKKLIGKDGSTTLPQDVKSLIDTAIAEKRSIFEPRRLVLYSETHQGNHHLLYLLHHRKLSDLDQRLIELFCGNVSIAFENHKLREEIDDTQREIVCILGEAIENRSKESGNHIHRVAAMMAILSKAHGFSDEEVARIKAASPLHDAGKIGIPDMILHKPGKLNDEEWAIMKTHVDIGYNLLNKSQRRTLRYAAIIAHEHHERWDGDGYPQGLAGEEIHILGRIAALVDVFDALTSVRCYKKAWPIDEAVTYVIEQSNKQFDPNIVRLFTENQQKLESICEIFVDPA